MPRGRVEHHHGAYLIFGTGGGRQGKLVQVDYDYPAEAVALGWNLMRVQKRPGGAVVHLKRRPTRGNFCAHENTDGTVDCSCGVTASNFIGAASEYLGSLAF
jgi:hypothetical protein